LYFVLDSGSFEPGQEQVIELNSPLKMDGIDKPIT